MTRIERGVVAGGFTLVVAACAVGPRPAERSRSSRPQIASLHGTETELFDLENGDRWVTSWHGGGLRCEVSAFDAAPDGRFVALHTRMSEPYEGHRSDLCRLLDVRRRCWSSDLELDEHFGRFWFASDSSRLVIERARGVTPTFQAHPISTDGSLGSPGPVCRPENVSWKYWDPTVQLVARNGRRAFVLEAASGASPARLHVLDLDTGSDRTIELPDAGWAGYSSRLFEDSRGDLFASMSRGLFRVDVDAARVRPVDLPGFTGDFEVAEGRLVAACREDARTRLVEVDLASGRRRWIDDAGAFGALTPTCFAISPDGRRIAVLAEPPPHGESPPPRLLLGDFVDGSEHAARLAQIDADFGPLTDLKWLDRNGKELAFSPDGRWLAFAFGGYALSADGLPMDRASALRVLNLSTGRMVHRSDYEAGAVQLCHDLIAGWCVASDAVRSD